MVQIKLNHPPFHRRTYVHHVWCGVIVCDTRARARARTYAHIQTKSFFQPDIYREADSLFSGTRIGALRF